jgi:hypothetical protein
LAHALTENVDAMIIIQELIALSDDALLIAVNAVYAIRKRLHAFVLQVSKVKNVKRPHAVTTVASTDAVPLTRVVCLHTVSVTLVILVAFVNKRVMPCAMVMENVEWTKMENLSA